MPRVIQTNQLRNSTMRRLLLFVGMIAVLASSALAAETTLLKRTIDVTPRRFLRYWKDPKAAEPIYNTYSWVPRINFDILGPVSDNSKIYTEFDMLDGKPWMTIDMRVNPIEDDVWVNLRSEDPNESVLEKKAILLEGLFPFRIKMKDGSTGAVRTLFTGKFKVGTYLLDQTIPEYKGKKDFFVDYDWHLPVAYLWLNPQTDADVPPLSTQICLRGKTNSETLEAQLLFNGKQIATDTRNGGERKQMTSPADEPSHRWSIWDFTFDRVKGFNRSQSAGVYTDAFYLDRNPGNYEIRIIRDKQLVRTINFAVGKDGKIVDNGITANAKLGGVRMIFPAKISGTLDGKINPTAWQTDALFGNPLAGFSVQ